MTIMKRLNINRRDIKLLIITMIIGLFIGWVLFSGSETEQNSKEDTQTETEETVYTCSMHPQIKQNKPGLCPICAMDLIPLESGISEGDHVDPNEIQMTESALALASVQTSIVKKAIPINEIKLLGKVEADERRVSEITARFGGRIETLSVNYTGQKVTKGQSLGTIYSPELIAAQKELLEAYKYKNNNPSLYNAAHTKLKLWGITDKQINTVIKSNKPQTYLKIVSPITGTVTKKQISDGDYVKEGSKLFEIIDLTNVWVMFEAYESDLPWIKEGNTVEFSVKSVPGELYKAKVRYIDPVIDKNTRVAYVRVELSNKNGKLKPGMFANGTLKSGTTNSKELLIPKSALLWTGKRAVVYVKVPDRKTASFIYREIVLGAEAGDYYVVASGLFEGEEIATNGVFRIDAAAQLAGKQSMMNPTGGGASMSHNHGNMQNNNDYIDETFRVSGNCNMCKSTIEKATKSLSGVSNALWSKETKELNVSYNPEEVNLNDIHKAIAAAGYDTDEERAPDSVYNNLPACCKYNRESANTISSNQEQTTFKVYGSCGMCKERIEKTARSLSGVKSADWDQNSNTITIIFNPNKVKLPDIHKAIAEAGHDTDEVKASGSVYNKLPECCKYRQ